MGQQTGVRSGLLLFIVGLWVLMRTVNRDQNHQTLINHILGTGGDASSTSASTGASSTPANAPTTITPAQSAAAANTTRAVQNPLSPVVTHVNSPFVAPLVRVTRHGVQTNVTVTTQPRP